MSGWWWWLVLAVLLAGACLMARAVASAEADTDRGDDE